MRYIALILALHLFTQHVLSLRVGVAKVDGTLPIGTPLAGYNYDQRVVPYWPIPVPRQYTTWMEPSIGRWRPTYVKATVIDDGNNRVAFVTLDVIGADGVLQQIAWDIAVQQGFTVPFEKCMFSAAHTHSGPGAISSAFLWSVAPATDLMVPELQQQFARSIAKALVIAEQTLQDAKIDIGITQLPGVTHNRRAGFSPYVKYDTVDTNLGVVRIDKADGTPLVTIWNFAIHGICYDAPNMKFSGDVMGSVDDWVESNVGGISMFINGDAGDVNPIFSVCCNNGPNFSGGEVIGKAVYNLRNTLKPSPTVEVVSNSQVIPFGMTNLNLTLQRLDNCTSGGPLDVCSLCMILKCDANIHLPSSWVAENPRFSAFRFHVNNKYTLIVSIPGEALTELGKQIRNDASVLKFDQVLLAGYSQDHLGYFATPDEYEIGGYESLLTFWGEVTSDMIRNGCKSTAQPLQPSTA